MPDQQLLYELSRRGIPVIEGVTTKDQAIDMLLADIQREQQTQRPIFSGFPTPQAPREYGYPPPQAPTWEAPPPPYSLFSQVTPIPQPRIFEYPMPSSTPQVPYFYR